MFAIAFDLGWLTLRSTIPRACRRPTPTLAARSPILGSTGCKVVSTPRPRKIWRICSQRSPRSWRCRGCPPRCATSGFPRRAVVRFHQAGQVVKPLFTVHAGEFLVAHEIKSAFPCVNVWVPAKDIGVDLLVTDNKNQAAVSLQVKFSRDYLVTHRKDAVVQKELRACGWWTPTRQQIEKSPAADYWIFVLVGFANRSTDFMP